MFRYDSFLGHELGQGGGPVTPTDISFVGGKTIEWDSAAGSVQAFDFTGLTGGSDSSPSVGDYVLIFMARASGGQTPPQFSAVPTGFSSTPRQELIGNDTNDIVLRLHDAFYEAGAASGGSFVADASTQGNAAIIMVFRGVDPDPLDVAIRRSIGTSSTAPNPGPTIPHTEGAWIVAVGATSKGGTFTTPADLTSFFQLFSTSSTYNCTLGAGLKTDWTSGEFDPAAFAGISADSFAARVSMTIVLKPTVAEPVEQDFYWPFVKLLTYGEGADGSQTFTDHSPVGRTMDAFGNVQNDTGIDVHGEAILFDGSGDYIAMSETDLRFGAGTDFCVEYFHYSDPAAYTDTVAVPIAHRDSGGWVIYHYPDGKIRFIMQTSSGTSAGEAQTATGVLAVNTIQHVACVREGTTLSIYLDGVLAATGTETGSMDAPNGTFRMGREHSSFSRYFKGSLNWVRYTVDNARYTDDFTPPVPPFPEQ